MISEHAFDKLRAIDCTFAEAVGTAEVIEERDLEPNAVGELLLAIEWLRPLHVVVVVDDAHEEEPIVTVYEPDPDQWSADDRRRR